MIHDRSRWILGFIVSLALGAVAQAAAPETVAVLATGPASLEGLDQDADGVIYVTSNFDQTILKVRPDGQAVGRVALPFHPQVVLVRGDDGLVVTGHDRLPDGIVQMIAGGPPPGPGAAPRKPSSFVGLGTRLLVLDKAGHVTLSLRGPDDAFFNGLTQVGPDSYIIADTIGGVLWRVDIAKAKLERWLTDVSAEGPGGKPSFGGANGLKVHQGYVYYTSHGTMWREKLGPQGQAEGAPTVFAAKGIDDFDIGKDGAVYLPVGTQIDRIAPDGSSAKFADMPSNSPAVRLSRDGRRLYILTRGVKPVDSGAPESRLMAVPVSQ